MDRWREPLPTRVMDTPELPAPYDDALRHGLAELGLQLAPEVLAVIEGHARLLLAWTPAINLTAIRDPARVARDHVIDSLSALPWIAARRPDRLLDLGSGGGYPGLPLAAALACLRPAPPMTLLEPIGKKARFLRTVVDATGVADRVHVDARRAEELAGGDAPGAAWSVITARAIATTADLVELAFPLLAPGGSLVAWKRGDLMAELGAAERAVDALGGGTLEVLEVAVDGLAGHRLVVATRDPRGHVPERYPRDPGLRKHRPW